MNILFVYYIASGGVETLNRQRSTALKHAGIHCDFLYYRQERPLMNMHDGQIFITNDNREIKAILIKGNYQAIVVTSDYKGLERLRKLGYIGKVLLEIQGFGPKDGAREELQQAIPYITRYANGILTSQTPHIIELLRELYPIFQKFIFHNCFNSAQFYYQALPKQPQPILGWVGRIEENKNWREFLYIAHCLRAEYHPELQLYMFEDPTLSTPQERREFEQLMKQLQLQDAIQLHANVPHYKMAEYFSIIGDSGGLLCSTSKVEGFGYAIVEAMSCRCPVLTTDSDGVRSSVLHNQTGKYYTLGDIEEAVREARELMTNTVLREHIRTTAQLHVQSHFSLEEYSKQFLSMLEKLGASPTK